jgi:hypothetical protein
VSVAISTPVTEGVIAALEAIENPAGGYINVGDAIKPPGPAKPPRSFYPYVVVRTRLIRSEGTLTDPKESALHRIESTSIGLDRVGVEWLDDQVRAALLDPNLAIDDHAVVWSEDAGGQSPRYDDDATPPVFFAVAIVNLMVSPTNGS